MTAIGSLRVELELADGSFTTRVIRAGTTLQQLENQLRKGVVAVRRLDDGMAGFGATMRDMVVTLGLARAAVENLYSVFGSWVTSIVKANAEVERSITLLKSMSNASTDVERTKQAREEFQQLLTLSSQSPFQLQSLTSAFVKMRAAGIEPASQQLRSLVDAVAAMGGTDDQFNRAATAIQQMAGKGVISMEELRQQLGEAVPRALELMARSMNMTVATFVQKVSQGQVEAKTALASLSAEFDRTFGGAAAAQMDTFFGKLTQLQTAWTRFALVVGGDPGSGGFFDKTKEFVQQLTDILSSPDAESFGRRLNEGLSSLTTALTEAVKWFFEWGSTIERAGKALLVLWAISRGYAVLSGLLVALNAVRMRLMTMPGEVAAVGTAFTRLNGAMTVANSGTFMSSMGRAAGSAAGLASSAAGAVARLGLLGGALYALGATGFVVSAVSLIADAFRFLTGQAMNATEALERFKMGALDKETIKAIEGQVDSLGKQIERARLEMETAAGPSAREMELQERLRLNPNDIDASAYRQELQKIFADREAAMARHNQRIAELEQERSRLQTDLRGALEDRLQRIAEQSASRELSQFRGELRLINSIYDAEQKALQAQREKLPSGTKDTDPAAQDIARRAKESRERFYSAQLNDTDAYIKGLEQRLETANETERRALEASLKAFRDYRLEIERLRDSGNLDGAAKLITANAENNIKVAEGQIARMRARMAELTAEMTGTNPELAKMNILLAELGRMEGLPPDLKDRLRAVAKELGETKDEYERFKKAVTAQRQLDTAFEKAKTDVAAFREQLQDLNLGDNERQFKQFERVVLAAFEVAVAGAGDAVEAVEALRRKMQETLDTARAASDLRSVTDYLQSRQSNLFRSLPKGSAERLDERLKQEKAAYDTAVAKLQASAGQISTAELQKSMADLKTTYDATVNRIRQDENGPAEAAGRKSANMLQNLKGRVAELTDELSNGGGEWAKYAAKLGEAGSKTSAGSKILEYAKEVDELTKKVEIAKNAWSTLENLVRRGDEGRRELDITLDMLRGGLEPTGIEAGYVREAAKAQRALDDLKKQGITAGAEFQAAQMRLQGLPGLAEGEIDKQILSWRQAQRQFRESSADSLADRRRIGEENIRIEEESIRRIIAATDAKGEKLKKMEDELQNYLKMRREQVARDTEGPIAKMMRDWGNLSDNIESSFARAFDGMTDALTEFVMTGKLSFTSLANSLIRDLTRIAIKAAASGIFDLLGGKSGSGGMDLLKSLGGFIGGLFGGGSPMAGVDANYAAYNHTGGIVGGNNPMMRVNPAWFAGANRYHRGSLRPDEVPTILQKGEAVFTSAQLAELGRLNRSYEFVERSLGAINSALTAPMSAMPSMPAAPMGGAGGMAPPVTVNIINQSGQQLEATAGTPRMDIEGMIVDVVVSNIQRPGRMRDAVKGVV